MGVHVGDGEKCERRSEFRLHLESSVLADKFEFGFMEGIETQFEEIMITEAEGAGEQAADFSVDALHFSAGEPCL